MGLLRSARIAARVRVFLEADERFPPLFSGSHELSPGENADLGGLSTSSEICPVLSLKYHSSFALQPLSLQLEQRFGAGRAPQSVHVCCSLGSCSWQRAATLPHAANCRWPLAARLGTLSCSPPRLQLPGWVKLRMELQ